MYSGYLKIFKKFYSLRIISLASRKIKKIGTFFFLFCFALLFVFVIRKWNSHCSFLQPQLTCKELWIASFISYLSILTHKIPGSLDNWLLHLHNNLTTAGNFSGLRPRQINRLSMDWSSFKGSQLGVFCP